jgi:transcriptional regulator with XRE-family HTH domain
MRKTFSNAISANMRTYFGLTQADLAEYGGISRGLVAHAEAGRGDYGSSSWLRLMPLAALVPPPVGAGPEEEAPEIETGLDADLLRQHLRKCEHEAVLLRRTLVQREQPRLYARRWLRALPLLLAELPAESATDNKYQRRTRRWLSYHTAKMEDVLDALPSTELRLQKLRLRQLEAEAAELRQWLATTDSGVPGA